MGYNQDEGGVDGLRTAPGRVRKGQALPGPDKRPLLSRITPSTRQGYGEFKPLRGDRRPSKKGQENHGQKKLLGGYRTEFDPNVGYMDGT